MADYVEDFNTGGNITSDWWPAGSTVKLCRVNWDSSYRDIVIFDNEQERNAYFDNLGKYFSYTVDNMSYLKPRQAIKVPIPYSTAYQYNYVMVTNPASPKYDEMRMFYFITQADYVAPSTTLVTLQLDVIMTYQFNTSIGSCFVERGHVAQANAAYRAVKSNGNYQYVMRRYLDVPEGLDVGSDYVTVDTECVSISDDGYYIIIMSTADLTADPGTINNPNLVTAAGNNVSEIPSSCEVYAMDATNWISWLNAMKRYPWVTQCIIAAYSFPKRFVAQTSQVTIGGQTAYRISRVISQTNRTGSDDPVIASIEGVFSRLQSKIDAAVKHDKFCIFPYSFIEISANTGTSVLLKPQYFTSDAIDLRAITCALYPFARIGVIPWNYGGRNANTYSVVWNDLNNQAHTSVLPINEALSNALWLSDFPMFSIVNNSYISYMASTAHSRAYSYEAAGWQLARTNLATNLSYEQAQGNFATQQMNRDLQNDMSRLNMAVGFGGGMIGAAGQLIGGNVGGAAQQAASTVFNAAMQQASYANSNQQWQNSMAQSQYVASSNYQLARQAASGDYEMAIKSINSTVQDAALRPPSTVGQSGGDILAQANGLYNITINFKMITSAVQNRIADFWSRYGYQINEFIQSSFKPMRDLKVMTRYSYWKMRECYLQNSYANNEELMTIKGILERGTTVWGNPNYIGSQSLDLNAVDESKSDWGY
jgi:hypothetical protein